MSTHDLTENQVSVNNYCQQRCISRFQSQGLFLESEAICLAIRPTIHATVAMRGPTGLYLKVHSIFPHVTFENMASHRSPSQPQFSPGGRFPPIFIHQVIIITGLKKLWLYDLTLKMALEADRALNRHSTQTNSNSLSLSHSLPLSLSLSLLLYLPLTPLSLPFPLYSFLPLYSFPSLPSLPSLSMKSLSQ